MTDQIPDQEVQAEKTNRPAKGPRGVVTIFGLWCKGCRICVEFCPTGVLAFDEHDHPYVAHPEKCTACHWCDTHCPDLAIVVTGVKSQ
ncbi:MAG: 4Fe-4S dicluster domain-containing protein [Chloroflexi bacterium]|nr:MAG: 4Fe-4S dicluster domain-containing protein [Chloroflexota bacterium]